MLIRFRIRFNSVCFARSSASTTKMPPRVWVPEEGEAPPRCWPSTVITTLSCGHLEMISSNLLCECISRVCLIDWFALMPTIHVGPMAFRLWIGMSDSIKRNIQLINSSLFARHRTNQTLIIERLTIRRARSDFEPPVLLKRPCEYLHTGTHTESMEWKRSSCSNGIPLCVRLKDLAAFLWYSCDPCSGLSRCLITSPTETL